MIAIITPIIVALYLTLVLVFFAPGVVDKVRAIIIPKYVKYGTRPFRDLEKWETEFLRDFINCNYALFEESNFAAGVGIGVIVVFPFVFFLFIFSSLKSAQLSFWIIMGGASIIGGLWKRYMDKRINITQDLVTPVNVYIGKFSTSGISQQEKDHDFEYNFGRHSAYLMESNPFYHQILRELKDGMLVAVEYSPRSGFVWSITPLDNSTDKKELGELGCYFYMDYGVVSHRCRSLTESEKKQLLELATSKEVTWDLENPIYIIRGKGNVTNDKGIHTIAIGSLAMQTDCVQNKLLKKYIEGLEDGFFEIEYSPLTLCVWDFRKIENP